MPAVSATEARKHFADLLDNAEAGREVLVERRGLTCRLSLVPPTFVQPPAAPLFVADAAVLNGDWSWVEQGDGSLTFAPDPK